METFDMDASARSMLQKVRHNLITMVGKTLEESSDEEFYRALSYVLREEIMINWTASQHTFAKQKVRKMYYFSLEWLIGRSLVNNMVNISHLEVVRRMIKLANREPTAIFGNEPDAGLGNGGLGRLAACYLDSLATLKMPSRGYGLRYLYGIFTQKIYAGHQIETPDNWLIHEYPLEMRRDLHAQNVCYGGKIVTSKNTHDEEIHNVVDYDSVRTIPYDIATVGYGDASDYMVLTLRLWSTAANPQNFAIQKFNEGDIADAVKNMAITHLLYPNDQNLLGFLMRIKQEFLLVSASIQDIIKEHLALYGTIDNLPEKVVIQLNDTHPVFGIPEMMRILTEEHDFPWGKAWDMTRAIFNYTNHTILKESLEEWDSHHIREILPRQMKIIEQLNQEFCTKIRKKYPGDESKVQGMSIIENEKIRMAHMAIYASEKVNGVAALHSRLVRKRLFPDFDEMFPGKFTNKTNGVTQRRWLLKCNPELSAMVTSLIGDKWVTDFSRIEDLKMFIDDVEVQQKFLDIKQRNKQRLTDSLVRLKKKKYGEEIDLSKELFLESDAIFDVQVKRIHEYKRQLMNLLRVVMLYQQILQDPSTNKVKKLILFGGKAAPGYALAKDIIRFAYMISRRVNNDPAMQDHLKVQFIEDYKVSSAEVIIPAADISEQISTAGYEASGTSNMKFSINGAHTMGTDDGANVEMRQEVGDEHWPFLFGASAAEIAKMIEEKSYSPQAILDEKPAIKAALDTMLNGTFAENEAEEQVLKELYNSLVSSERPDPYFVLYDLTSYVETHAKVDDLFKDKNAWAKSSLYNMASMGKFSSDRAIKEYAEEIWKISPCEIDQHELTSVRRDFKESDRCFFQAG